MDELALLGARCGGGVEALFIKWHQGAQLTVPEGGGETGEHSMLQKRPGNREQHE